MGRVWPRHRHRGPPLNSVVSRHQMYVPETRRGRMAFALVMIAAFYAVVVGLYAGFRWLRGTPLEWTWWQYALAPVAIVALKLASEPLLDRFAVFLNWRHRGNPLWKRGISWMFILAAMASVPIGIWYLETSYR